VKQIEITWIVICWKNLCVFCGV